jgi:hypothetical protein
LLTRQHYPELAIRIDRTGRDRRRLLALGAVQVVKRSLALSAVLTAAVAAAGCGGGSPSPQQTWAESVCKPLVQWKDQIQSISDDVTSELKSPSLQTPAALKSSISQAEQATKTLVSDLRAVGPPPGEDGTNAKDLVNGLGDNLQRTLTTVQGEVQQLQSGANVSQAISTLGEVGAQVSGAVTQAQSTLESIGALTDDLKSGVDKADSCKKLQSD